MRRCRGGLLGGGAWLWLRDSSLVAVQRVTVTGASGPDAAQIRSALAAAARNMTTLDVHMETLQHRRRALPGRQGPRCQHPVPARDADPGDRAGPGRRSSLPAAAAIAVAGDGTLLHDVRASPTAADDPDARGARAAPGSPDAAGEAVAVLAAAPVRAAARTSARSPRPRATGWSRSCATARASTSATTTSSHSEMGVGGRRAGRLGISRGAVHRRHRPRPASRRKQRLRPERQPSRLGRRLHGLRRGDVDRVGHGRVDDHRRVGDVLHGFGRRLNLN